MLKKSLLSISIIMAGNIAAIANGSVAGKVLNQGDKAPIDFANVVLVAESGHDVVGGAATNEEGVFTIAGVPAGRYILRVSFVGYITQEREVVVGDTDVTVAPVLLVDDAKLLQEVVVVGTKGQMTVNAEHRIFNVSSNVASTGASAQELLAAVPSVSVSADGDISLRGNDDVLVWINGKVMGMNADNRAQFLRQIPAETIESIEVMTNPSARNSTEGTAGIINIRLKEDHRHGYFGNAEANVDTRGTININASVNYNEGKFESVAAIGLKSAHTPGGMKSFRDYDDGASLTSTGHNKKHENSVFLRLGTNYKPDDNNTVYISAIGTLGHKWGNTQTLHNSTLPNLWSSNLNHMHEKGDTRGANILLGYKHDFGRHDHFLDINANYNIWQGPNDNRFTEHEIWPDGTTDVIYQSQHQDVKISNWEAAVDYSNALATWFTLEAGYKGNYNHENSPASYYSGTTDGTLTPLPELYNRFKYDTDITAFYFNLSGDYEQFTFSAGLRGEMWQIRTRSLGYDQSDTEVEPFKKNDFALFPSASIGWNPGHNSEFRLNYSRRIRRPYGPQLNTFENISDPSEVHLGNPSILPEYSNSVELTYIKNWSRHMLSVSGYMRSNSDMISHVSFLAPMASNPQVNTMYYGHANVGNMLNTGVEILSRNTLLEKLTLTTTFNVYNNHLKAWTTDYPLHGSYYQVHGARQDRVVWDLSCMASVRLPWDMTFQATGRYRSRSVTAQGTLQENWDVEAGLRKNVGAWGISLICKDIFNSNETKNILLGNGYRQSIAKWTGGRTLRLAVTYTFGKTHSHDHDHDHHNHIDTGGYGEEHHHH